MVHKQKSKLKDRQFTKFKLRRPDYMYTLKVQSKEKADKLIKNLPQSLLRSTEKKKQK